MSDLIVRDAYEGGYNHGNLIRAEIHEGFGNHQIAILDYPVTKGSFTNYAPELTPLAFRWGFPPAGLRTFWGYVNHHETVDTDVDGEVFLRFFCIGTSQPLNAPSPTSWKNVTGSYIARQVAEKHGLRCVVHNSKTLLPYWTPGQQSDFLMLNRLADQIGFRFWVDGATLFFVDPSVLLTSPDRSVAAEYEFNRSSTDTLFGIRSISGSLAPVASAPTVQQIFGIDEDTGKVFRSSSARQSADLGLATPVNRVLYSGSVNSLAEAHAINTSAAMSGDWASLQAITRGDGKARVGSLVSLGGASLNQLYAGVWMASGITHVISPVPDTMQWTYSAQLELTRNQKDQTFFSSYTTMKDALSEVPAVLRNGNWESENLESVYV